MRDGESQNWTYSAVCGEIFITPSGPNSKFSSLLTSVAREMRKKLHTTANRTTIAASSIEEALILVVEDDAAQRELMGNWLSMEGLPYITASSIADAIAALKGNKVNLLVLDWGLDRSGAEVLRECMVLNPQMPVIVVSGQPYDVRTDALVAQAVAFLNKPLSGTVLTQQIRRLLKRCDARPEPLLPQELSDIRPLSEIKALYIRHVLRILEDNISLAAEKLGIHRQTVARFASVGEWRPGPEN